MNDYLIPLTTACTLITLHVIAMKLRNRLLDRPNEIVLIAFLTGLASILMMLLPAPSDLLIRDLRCIPLIMAGLSLGWPAALLSVLPPAIYGFWLHEPFAAYELVHSLLLPAIFSSLLHRKQYRTAFASIPLSSGVLITVMLVAGTAVTRQLVQPTAWEDYWLADSYMAGITLVCLLILIAMHNMENKSWLLQRRLELEANQDRLTGLPNFRSFAEIAENTLKTKRIGIFMIDIDNFKLYNDTLGHPQGDRLLREVGQLLLSHIGEKDYVARYGGEEFIVMCNSTDDAALTGNAHRLCTQIAGHSFADRTGKVGGFISISIGISVAKRPGDDLSRIISEADQALYESKHRGKNRYTFYSPDLSSPAAAKQKP